MQQLIINANHNIQSYGRYGYRVIPDDLSDYRGPLAGMLIGLRNATHDHVAFVPCDASSLPPDLVTRLWGALHNVDANVCIVHDGTRLHPVFAFMNVAWPMPWNSTWNRAGVAWRTGYCSRAMPWRTFPTVRRGL